MTGAAGGGVLVLAADADADADADVIWVKVIRRARRVVAANAAFAAFMALPLTVDAAITIGRPLDG